MQFIESVAEDLNCECFTAETFDGRFVCGLEDYAGEFPRWEAKAYGETPTEAEENLNALLHAAGYYRDKA